MIIYDDEKHLTDKIKNSKTTALCLSVKLEDDKSELFARSLDKIRNNSQKSLKKALAKLSTNPHPDLLYGSAILVSTVKNKNDDIFLPGPTWAARNTPINTPFDDDHVENDIIGHIFASRVLDENGKEYTGDEAPDYFDIEVDFVVYKEVFPKIAAEILEKAPKGEKFVSMEATLEDFDYGIISGEKIKIVSRNKETSFLTKYLRAYGGSGKYDGADIGRIVKDFRFTGMGNVDEPANAKSKYTKLIGSEVIDQKEILHGSKKAVIYIVKGNIMKIESVEQAEKVIAELIKERDEAKAQIEKSNTEAVKAETVKLSASVTELTTKLDTEKTKVEVAEQKHVEAQAKYAELDKNLTTVKAELEKATKELNEINAQKKSDERIAKLKSIGVTLTDEKAKKISAMTDEAFTQVVDFAETLKPTGTKEEVDATKVLETAEATKETELEAAGSAELEVSTTQIAEKLAAAVRSSRNKKVNISKENK